MWLSLSLTKILSIKKVQSYFTFPVEKETMSDETTIEFSLVPVHNKPFYFAITLLLAAFAWLKNFSELHLICLKDTRRNSCLPDQSVIQMTYLEINWEHHTVGFIYFLYFDIASRDHSKKMSCLQQATTRSLSKMESRFIFHLRWVLVERLYYTLGVPAPSLSLHTLLSEFSSLFVAIMF